MRPPIETFAEILFRAIANAATAPRASNAPNDEDVIEPDEGELEPDEGEPDAATVEAEIGPRYRARRRAPVVRYVVGRVLPPSWMVRKGERSPDVLEVVEVRTRADLAAVFRREDDSRRTERGAMDTKTWIRILGAGKVRKL